MCALPWLWIGQHRLHDCKLQLDDELLEGASLYPLFDSAGTTRALMLTTADRGGVLLGEWRPGLVQNRLLRPIRLRLRRADLASSPDEVELGRLWHYDPWWELGEDRYRDHPAAAQLKETNLPGYDDSFTRLWFDSELSRVVYLATGSGESMNMVKFSASRLGKASVCRSGQSPPEPRRPARREPWRLRPFWQ